MAFHSSALLIKKIRLTTDLLMQLIRWFRWLSHQRSERRNDYDKKQHCTDYKQSYATRSRYPIMSYSHKDAEKQSSPCENIVVHPTRCLRICLASFFLTNKTV